jgi:imidazolonepropionase-like amidohydrolase
MAVKKNRVYILLCLSSVWLPSKSYGEEITAIKADRIDTVTSGLIENGVIVIRGGKISAIGADVKIPSTANIIDARDKTVFPGLVNPCSVVGLSGSPGGEPVSHPHYRVADELYPFQDVYRRILQAGFTTLGLTPGGNGIAGQGAIIRPIGQTPEQMLITESGFLMIRFEANENAKKIITEAFESAKKQTDSADPKVKPLVRALQGEIPTLVRCGGPGATMHLLPLLKPYEKMKWVLVADPENYRIAEKLAKAKIPVIFPAQIDFEQFTRNRINVPKILAEAGVKIACVPRIDNAEGHEDFLRQMAELTKGGLDKETAKKSMTIYPAQMLALDYRLGSLEVGKDANLLILSADPLEVGAKIDQVMLEGKIVYRAP